MNAQYPRWPVRIVAWLFEGLATFILLLPAPSLADDNYQLLGRLEERVDSSDPVEGLLRKEIPGLGPEMAKLPPFIGDSDLKFHFRTYYLDRKNSDATASEAWAIGGWLAYRSGWLHNILAIGAAGYTSQPAYAPDDADKTNLLAPGQKGITVLGEAYGQLRYEPHATLTGYRQRVDDGYVNPQDNRMIPNTFEGVTLRGEKGQVKYNLGYLWDIKPRNSDDFISMSQQAISQLPTSQQAGASGPDEGLVLTSVTLEPLTPLKKVSLGNYYVPDLFNTALGRVEYEHVFDERKVEIALQYTDQRAVGADRLGPFNTWNVGARVQYTWKEFTLGAAGHVTSDNATIKSPYGAWPGYLALIQTDFDRAGEKAWGVSAKYEKKLDAGEKTLSLFVAYAQGTDRQDPSTGDSLPTTREVDVDIIYKYEVKFHKAELRFRNAFVDDGGARLSYQIRHTLNYEVDLL